MHASGEWKPEPDEDDDEGENVETFLKLERQVKQDTRKQALKVEEEEKTHPAEVEAMSVSSSNATYFAAPTHQGYL